MAKRLLWALIVVLALAIFSTLRDGAYFRRMQRDNGQPCDYYIHVVEPKMRLERDAELDQAPPCDAPPCPVTTQPATVPASQP